MARKPPSKIYMIWGDMLSRCRNVNHKSYPNYGGRGITVCERWLTFQNFEADMGARPEGRTLDRIDNDGPYAPHNCRWATRQEQSSNRRNSIFVDCDGERVTLREYCRRKSLTYRPIVKRIQSRGWPIAAALSIPLGTGKHFGKGGAS